jgi:transcriptional regulator with XRE-family HTH domain
MIISLRFLYLSAIFVSLHFNSRDNFSYMSENERLKEIRKALELTQREFSETLDIKQGSYSDVERGKAGISAILLKNLIRRFRVNPLWLCEGEGDMFIENVDNKTGSFKNQDITVKQKIARSFIDKEQSVDSLEQTRNLELQHDNLENLKSIIDFLNQGE